MKLSLPLAVVLALLANLVPGRRAVAARPAPSPGSTGRLPPTSSAG